MNGKSSLDRFFSSSDYTNAFRYLQIHKPHDLCVSAALSSPTQDVSFHPCGSAPGLALAHAGPFEDALRDPFLLDAGEPAADCFFTDTAGGCCPPAVSVLELADS